MEEVSGTEYRSMYDAVKNVLAEMAAKGGRDTEKDLFARPGGYTTILSKKTLWTPCPRCGYELRKGTYLGGTIYYCEHLSVIVRSRSHPVRRYGPALLQYRKTNCCRVQQAGISKYYFC